MQEAPRASRDLERILALPRRPQPSGEELVESLTAALKTPSGTMKLRPVQAAALHEAVLAGGLVGAIGVGEGKTLLDLLLPVVLGARRTVLLIPPELRDQVINRNIPELSKHWRIPKLGEDLYVVAYSELSSARAADVLEKLQPDLVIADEAHRLKHSTAACTKRFRHYFKTHPDTKLCALSGTLVSKSIRDFGHLSKFALRDGSPLPHDGRVLVSWAEAVDPGEWRSSPGDLTRLCEGDESARDAFRRRLLDTPGVISTCANRVSASLVFYERELANIPPDMQRALNRLRETWCIGEEEISDALTFSRYARQLAAGLYLKWVWPRGEPVEVREEWMAARRDWNRAVRQRLKASLPGQDSPLLCQRAAQMGRWHCPAWEPWFRIRKAARPSTEAVWVSDYLVRDAVRWGNANIGVIWVEHEALGEAIARLGHFPLYGAGEEASRRISDESGRRTIVASRRSHGTGKNLNQFYKQLVTTPSSNAATWEQLLGRLHREPTASDEVEVHVYLHTPEMRKALDDARVNARFIEGVKGRPDLPTQRLLYAAMAA